MSANEVIEQIRQLSREEQEQVFDFVRNLRNEGALPDERGVQYMDAQKAKKVSGEIFSERSELFRKLAS
jgi:hypothetical protein